jgi:hypothetical protein
LCVSVKKIQKEGHSPERTVLGSIPGEGGFGSLENKHDRRKHIRPELLVSTRIFYGKKAKNCPGFEEIAGTKITNSKYCPGFEFP